MSASTRNGLPSSRPNPSLFALFGKGYLAITFDQPVDRRALSGHRAARGRAASPRRCRAFRPVRANSEPRPARGREARRPWSRAASSSSICRKARRAASGSTRGSIIPNGSMSGPRGVDEARQSRPIRALPLEDLLWRLFHEEAEVRLLEPVPLRPGLPLQPRLCAAGHRPLPGGGARGDGRRRWVHQRRLRLLLARLPDHPGRSVLANEYSSRPLTFSCYKSADEPP